MSFSMKFIGIAKLLLQHKVARSECLRCLSVGSVLRLVNLPPVVDYSQLKTHLKFRNAIVVDVRQPHERVEIGAIDGSVNIPLDMVKEVFEMSPQKFKETFKAEMPGKDTAMIFHCMSGVRSTKAVDAMKELGYTNIGNYTGGFKDWADKSNPTSS